MFNRSLPSITLEQIARQLHFIRRANGLKTVLVLGSQAGALFRRPALQYLVQALAMPQEQDASSYAQFARCFQQLTLPELFSSAEQQALLHGALAAVAPSEADLCLARLIIQGYFDPIITTNVDSLLEQTLTKAGWQQFTVINLTTTTEERSLTASSPYGCSILKVFGSLINQQCVLANRYAHISNMLRYHALTELLQRDCLIIGMDQAWDAALHYLFPPQGDTCWLIAREAGERFYALKETRNVLLMQEKNLIDYEVFFTQLSHMLDEPSSGVKTSNRAKPVSLPVPDIPINTPSPQPALEVFISYHESDEPLLYKLVDNLANLKRAGLINDWFKSKIQAGQSIADVTQQYLARSDLFLLLVSQPLIASDTHYQEIQQMMQRHQAKQALVIPILLRPADWEHTPFGALNPLPSNRVPVTSWRNHDSAFLNIVQGLRQAITAYQLRGS